MATTPINKLKVYSKILYWTPHFKVKYDIAICSSLQKIEKPVSIQLFIDLFLCAQLDVRWVCDALIFNLYSWMYCLGQGLPCPFCLTQGLAYISKLWLVTSSSVQTLINLSIRNLSICHYKCIWIIHQGAATPIYTVLRAVTAVKMSVNGQGALACIGQNAVVNVESTVKNVTWCLVYSHAYDVVNWIDLFH